MACYNDNVFVQLYEVLPKLRRLDLLGAVFQESKGRMTKDGKTMDRLFRYVKDLKLDKEGMKFYEEILSALNGGTVGIAAKDIADDIVTYYNRLSEHGLQEGWIIPKKKGWSDDQIGYLVGDVLDSRSYGTFVKHWNPELYSDLISRDNRKYFEEFFDTGALSNDSYALYIEAFRVSAHDSDHGVIAKARNQRLTTIQDMDVRVFTKTFVEKVVGLPFYLAGQTIAQAGQLALLWVANTLGWGVETAARKAMRTTGITDTEIKGLMGKYNIMHSPGTEAGVYNGISIFDRLKDFFVNINKYGAYNFTDYLLYNTSVQRSVVSALEKMSFKSVAEFEAHVAKFTNEMDRSRFLGEVQLKAQEEYRQSTSMNFAPEDGQFLIHGAGAGLRKPLFWAWNFMGARGTSSLKNSIKTIAGGFGEKRWLELLQTQGESNAKKLHFQYYQLNDPLYYMFAKVFMATQMGQRLDRVINRGEEDSFMDRVKGAVYAGQVFSFNESALQSSPMSRAIIKFFEGLQVNDDGPGVNDVTAGMFMSFKQVMSDMSRRFAAPRAMIRAFGDSTEFSMEKLWSHYMDVTGGYMYFMQNEVETKGYSPYIPKTVYSYMASVFPYTNNFREMYNKLDTDRKIQLLTNNIPLYIGNYMNFALPFWKEFNIGGIAGITHDMDMVVNKLEFDQKFNDTFLKGHIPLDGDQFFGTYVYSQMMKFYIQGANEEKDRLDGLRKNYPSWSPDQVKENAFVTMMLEELGSEKSDVYLKEFNKADSAGIKQGLQLVAFAEAMSPGAGREILATTVAKEMNDIAKRLGYGWAINFQKENPDLYKQYTYQFAEKYGDLLYVVDKDARSNLAAYYVGKTYPEFRKEGFLERPPTEKGEFAGFKATAFQGSMVHQLFQLDMFAKMAIAEGNPNGYEIANAYAMIWLRNIGKPIKPIAEMTPEELKKYEDSKAIYAKDPDYLKFQYAATNKIVKEIKESTLSDQSKITMIAGITAGLIPSLDQALKNEPLRKELGVVFDETMHWLYGNIKDEAELGKAIGFQILSKKGYNPKTTERTGTFLDDYYYDGKSYNGYFNRKYYDDYNFLTNLFNKNRMYVQRNIDNFIKYGRGKPYSKQKNDNYYSPAERQYLKYLGKYNDERLTSTYTAKLSNYERQSNYGFERIGRGFSVKGGKAKKIPVKQPGLTKEQQGATLTTSINRGPSDYQKFALRNRARAKAAKSRGETQHAPR